MKIKSTAFLLTLAAVFTGHCLALTPIEEDFQASKLDKSRWHLIKSGHGRFVQSRGKLNFLVSAPTQSDYVALELEESRPGISEDWEMILDVSNSVKYKEGFQSSCGFLIYNDRNNLDYLYVNFFGKSGIDAGAYNNGVYFPARRLTLGAAVPKGAMRVSFNKTTKLMTFYASLTNKEEGYDWFKVGTFAPVGAKKADVKADWGMSATQGLFVIQLTGFGIKQSVSNGQINIDNFSLQAP